MSTKGQERVKFANDRLLRRVGGGSGHDPDTADPVRPRRGPSARARRSPRRGPSSSAASAPWSPKVANPPIARPRSQPAFGQDCVVARPPGARRAGCGTPQVRSGLERRPQCARRDRAQARRPQVPVVGQYELGLQLVRPVEQLALGGDAGDTRRTSPFSGGGGSRQAVRGPDRRTSGAAAGRRARRRSS
jgi:hypothetical protein